MILSLDVEGLRTPEQVRAFLDGNDAVVFQPASRSEAHAFVSRMLSRFGYAGLDRPDRGLLKRFPGKATGLSRAQVTRLVAQFLKTGCVVDRRGGGPRRPFERRYTAADIRLLAEVDATLGQMAGPATRAIMRREFEVCGDERYRRMARPRRAVPRHRLRARGRQSRLTRRTMRGAAHGRSSPMTPHRPRNRSPPGGDGAHGRCPRDGCRDRERWRPIPPAGGHHPRPQRGVVTRPSRVRFADRDASGTRAAFNTPPQQNRLGFPPPARRPDRP
ncbi:MAG: hypothetical protein OXH52_18695 [Gammaproteobacteria bacterium]|nr:hypothetical protein [Gammaproteobacteria bacterium]